MQELIQAIGTVGFPIVCCLYMMFQNSKQTEAQNKQNAEIQKRHDENLEELRKVIGDLNISTNNLVTLITRFIDRDNSNG